MSMRLSFKEESRNDWTRCVAEGGALPTGDIQLGAILRIADATELMAKNHNRMQADLEYYKKAHAEQQRIISKLQRRISSLKGVITHMKKSSQPLDS